MAELEGHGGHGPSDLLKDELSQSLEELEALLKAKDEVGTYCPLGSEEGSSDVDERFSNSTSSVPFIRF